MWKTSNEVWTIDIDRTVPRSQIDTTIDEHNIQVKTAFSSLVNLYSLMWPIEMHNELDMAIYMRNFNSFFLRFSINSSLVL